MTATAVAVEPIREEASVSTAYRLLWLAVIFNLLAFGIGFDWDRRWHATHPFEDFFSPPHLFIYSMHFCGPITLAGAGFVVIALAGVFDSIWHTRFGLDETVWSFPHSMLGWGLFVSFLGVTSCRLALRQWRPIGWVSAVVFSFLIFTVAAERFAGPLANNLSRETVELVARIPVLAVEPAFQHTTRIYLAEDLTRHNPLFVPLTALSAGLALGLLRSFDARPWVTVVITALVS